LSNKNALLKTVFFGDFAHWVISQIAPPRSFESAGSNLMRINLSMKSCEKVV